MRTRWIPTLILAAVLAMPLLAQRRDDSQRHQDQRSEELRGGSPGGFMQHRGEMQQERRGEQREQQREERQERREFRPRANRGRLPEPPPKRERNEGPEVDRRGGRMNNMPHVRGDHWYGRDRPDDHRYRLERPYEHGRFDHFGMNYRYDVSRIDRDDHRFWFPDGACFQIAPWDWTMAEDWCWDCGGGDFVVYLDPDHPGWYLLYDIFTGQFIHVRYLGMLPFPD